TYWSGAKALRAQTYNLQFRINAENDRARLAEKRRIYAAFMNALGTYVVVERNLIMARSKGSDEERLMTLRSELTGAMTNMLNALFEIRLIASENLAHLSVGAVQRLTTSEDPSDEFPELRDSLYELMRADLGEPIHRRIDAPEIAAQAR